MKRVAIILVVTLTISSCTHDSESPQIDLLIGTWSITDILEDSNLSQSLTYDFSSNGTFSVTRVIIDNSTNNIIGYRYRALGSFMSNEDELTLNKVEIYSHNDSNGLYSDINSLELSNENITETVNFSIDNTGGLLTFYYKPCGPNENCIGFQSFQKVN